MPNPRTIHYGTISDLIADVERLQRGYVSAKNWSLPQTAWHCGMALKSLQPVSAGAQSTPEQLEQKKARIDPLLAQGIMPQGLPTPSGLNPFADAPPLDDGTVNQFLADLQRLDQTSQPQIAFGRFGLVTLDEFKQFILIHSTNHLQNLIPTT